MTPVALLAEVRRLGADLSLRGPDLMLHRGRAVGPGLRALVSAAKPELRELLAEAAAREGRRRAVADAEAALYARLAAVLGATDHDAAFDVLARLRPVPMLAVASARDRLRDAGDAYAAGAGTWEAFRAAAGAWEAAALPVARELAAICHDCGREAVAALADPFDGSRFCWSCARSGAERGKREKRGKGDLRR